MSSCREGLAKVPPRNFLKLHFSLTTRPQPPKAPKSKLNPSTKEAGPTTTKRKNSNAEEAMISKIDRLEGSAKFDRPPVKARRIEDFYSASTGVEDGAKITLTKSTGGTTNRFKAVPKVVAASRVDVEEDGSDELASDLTTHLARNKVEREAYLRRPLSDSDSDPVVAGEEEDGIETSGDEAIKELETEKVRPVIRARRTATKNEPIFIGRYRLDSDEDEASLPTLEEMARDSKPKKSKNNHQTFNFTDSSEEHQLAPQPDEQDFVPSSPLFQRSDSFLHSSSLPPVGESNNPLLKITSPPSKPFKRTRFESPLPTHKRHKSIPTLSTSSDDPIDEDFSVVGDLSSSKAAKLFTPTAPGSNATIGLVNEGSDEMDEEIEQKDIEVETTSIRDARREEEEEDEMEEEDDMDAWLSANVTVVG